MPVLPDWVIQALQVITILALTPLVSGVIARAEAVVQQRRGPRVLQPYYRGSSVEAISRVAAIQAGLIALSGSYPLEWALSRQRVVSRGSAGVPKRVVEGGQRVPRVNVELEELAGPLVLDRDRDVVRERVPQQPDVESVVDSLVQLAGRGVGGRIHDRFLPRSGLRSCLSLGLRGRRKFIS